MNQAKLEVYFFGVLFLAVIAATARILWPYAVTIAIAAIFAVLVYPLYETLRMRVKSEAAAAGATLVLSLVAIILPLTLVISLLVQEAQGVSAGIASGQIASAQDLIAPLKARIIAIVPQAANFNVDELLREGTQWITGWVGGIFAGTAGAVLSLFVGLIAFYYFLKDGSRFATMLVRLSPLEDAYDREILGRLKTAVTSVITGTLLVAGLQGLLVGIGFALFGLQNPILWGAVATVAAMVPGLGTALVIAPAVIYLFYMGETVASFGLMAWGICIVGLVDNFIAPRLFGRGTAIHPLFVLLSILGGLSTMGPSGFILGPIVLSLLVALGHVYSLLNEKRRKAELPLDARASEEEIVRVDYSH